MTAEDDWYALIKGRNGERLVGWRPVHDFPPLPTRRLKWQKEHPERWLQLMRKHRMTDEQIAWCLAHPHEAQLKAREARRIHAVYREKLRQERCRIHAA